jgi:hypothetical protein
MAISNLDPMAPRHLTSLRNLLARPFNVVRQGSGVVVRQVPPTAKAAQAGARTAAGVLRTTSDSTLRWLTATSLGVGAGLYFSGKRRLALTAAVVPAVVAGATIALRGRDGSIDLEQAADRPIEPPVARKQAR